MSAAASAAAIAALVQATKASGVIVRVGEQGFRTILERNRDALVVHSYEGFLSKRHRYLVSYKGLAFFTQTERPLSLPVTTEIIEAKKIWIPD